MSDETKCARGSFRDYDGERWNVIYCREGDDFKLVLGEQDDTEIDCIPVEAMRRLQQAIWEGSRDRQARRLKKGDPDRAYMP